MNDYLFANKLYSLRKAAGLTQAQVARLVGVSDKTVSKWENGNARPASEALQKLAALFKVSAGERLKLRDRSDGPMITKIVITGGPCAGKTTGRAGSRTRSPNSDTSFLSCRRRLQS